MNGKNMILLAAAVICSSAVAYVKPLSEPWLKAGEKVAFYGDSITYRSGYFQIVSNELAKIGVTAVNAGVGGDNTETAMVRIRDVAALRPDAVVIFLGTNDSACGRGRWRGEPTIEPITYRDNLLWMTYYFRRHDVKKISFVPSAGRIEGGQYLDFGNRRELYNQMTRDSADKADAVFVPLDVVFDEARKLRTPDAKGHIFTLDDVHMTPEGSELIADTMLKAWKMKK